METAGGITIAFVVMFILLWALSSHRLVYYSTPLLSWIGLPWAVIDQPTWSAIKEAKVVFRMRPNAIPLLNYLSFVNTCLQPMSWAVCAIFTGWLGKRLFARNEGAGFRRKLGPMAAAHEIAKVFPAIIPVLHLGPDLVADKLPLWRRQTFPEDVWSNEKVPVKTPGGSLKAMPLTDKGKLVKDRVFTYFRGGERSDGPVQLRGERRWSKMLGYQVVDLLEDAKKHEGICFPDRFSPQGKVLFALLTAHAFGGREGKADYQKAADQLNRTCAGQKNGLPNLKVAQWLYDKYRMNPQSKKLFAIHHWEYSYLYSLFFKAKMTGKATHTDFIWLKPLDRILFYVLNTVGRATPHAEAAAVFSQYDYETAVAKIGNLPLHIGPDGKLQARIAVETAVEGLEVEFLRFSECVDDGDDWWQNLKLWQSAREFSSNQTALQQKLSGAYQDEAVADELRGLVQSQATQAQQMAQMGSPEETVFDTLMSARAAQRESEQTASNLNHLFGSGQGLSGARKSGAGGGDGGIDLGMG